MKDGAKAKEKELDKEWERLNGNTVCLDARQIVQIVRKFKGIYIRTLYVTMRVILTAEIYNTINRAFIF